MSSKHGRSQSLPAIEDSSIHRPFAQNTGGRKWKRADEGRDYSYTSAVDHRALFINLSSITGMLGDRKTGSLQE
jgi:hypothetical protein